MVAPVLSFLLALVLTGPERQLAPPSIASSPRGSGAAIGAGGNGFLSVWQRTDTNLSYYARLDREGRLVDRTGIALPNGFLSSPVVGWNGSEYVIAAMSVSGGGIVAMRVRENGTLIDTTPRLTVPLYYAVDLHLVFNGTELLLTWYDQTGLTQALSGVLLEPDLDVIKGPFAITSRDVSTIHLPLDRLLNSSVATNGSDFLLTWETPSIPQSFTFHVISASGDVTDGATLHPDSPPLLPQVVADDSGYVVVWHDRAGGAIRAQRVTGDGTPASSPVTLVQSGALGQLVATSDGSTIGVVWVTTGRMVSAQRFTGALQPVGAPRAFESGEQAQIATDDGVFVAGWNTIAPTVRAAVIANATEVQTISNVDSPVSQVDVQAASDGEQALAVWTEGSTVLAAIAGGQPPAAIGSGAKPQVAFGGGRYLVAWKNGDSIAGRFLRRDGSADGAEFVIANASSTPKLAFDGDRFALVWSEGSSLRGRRVSLAAEVSPTVPFDAEGTVTLGGIAAGAGGEIAALYRTESSERVALHTARLHGNRWEDEQLLASAKRPCLSLACVDYVPIAVGWNGAQYLGAWSLINGPGRTGELQTSTLDGAPIRSSSLAEPYVKGGDLAWTGSSFLLVFGVNSGQGANYLVRIGDEQHPTRFYYGADTFSPPDIVVVQPEHALMFYDHAVDHVSRVYWRDVTVVFPKQRAVRTR